MKVYSLACGYVVRSWIDKVKLVFKLLSHIIHTVIILQARKLSSSFSLSIIMKRLGNAIKIIPKTPAKMLCYTRIPGCSCLYKKENRAEFGAVRSTDESLQVSLNNAQSGFSSSTS